MEPDHLNWPFFDPHHAELARARSLRLYPEIRALRIDPGPSEVQLLLIARELLAAPRGDTRSSCNRRRQIQVTPGSRAATAAQARADERRCGGDSATLVFKLNQGATHE